MNEVQRSNRAVISDSGLRSVRTRAALIVAIWALSGVWHVEHALAHALEHAHHHAVDGSIEVGAESGHGHNHPESAPAVTSRKAPEFAAPTLRAPLPEFDLTAPARFPLARIVLAHASSGSGKISGPRAPPLS